MFELVLAMCVILLVFTAMCVIEKIPGIDKVLEKGVERTIIFQNVRADEAHMRKL